MTGADEDFSAFFEATWPRLFRTTYAVAGTVEDAEEALQTAFARAYATWGRISRLEHPAAYVRRMAVNEALSGHRRSSRRTASLGELLDPRTPTDDSDVHVAGMDVWAAVSSLPRKQRAVLVLRYYEGLSEAEIAEVLGVRPGTVKSQASDALAALRRRFPDLHPHSVEGDAR
ncbi:MAG: SigE family RNA polymerase sigma factor [Nocardioidaceae bacterium]